jgi:diamine N-acetyltransferase
VNQRTLQDETPVVNIVGEKVALGPVERRHLELDATWRNNLETLRTMGSMARPLTVERREATFNLDEDQNTDVTFMIYVRESLTPIGMVGLSRINGHHRTAEFGIMIGEPAFRGRGYGSEATRLMLEYAFTVLALQNVLLQVIDVNDAGIRAYQRAGFRVFGRRRRAWFSEGKFYDMIYMDCTSEDLSAGEHAARHS